MGEHTDGDDNDHLCDYGCGQVADEGCHDVNTDADHNCDECGAENVTEHVDNNKDHVCDYGCDKYFDTHADSAEDDDHVCDYGCGAVLENCQDCSWNFTDNGDGTHDAYCSICNTPMQDNAEHTYNNSGVCVCNNTAAAKVGDTYYCTLAKAVAAADGRTVVLCKDVTLTEKLTVATKQVWDFGSYTLTIADVEGNYGLIVKGDLTMENGKFVVAGMYGIGVTGKLTINGGNFSVAGDNDYLLANWGTTVINNGSFSGQYSCVNNFSGTTIIYGGSYTTAESDCTGEYPSCDLFADSGLTVNGGTFSKDVTEHCEAGYHTILVNGSYVYGKHTDSVWNYTDNGNGTHDAICSGCGVLVVNDAAHSYDTTGECVCGNTAEAKVGETYYCTLAEAIAAADNGSTVILCKSASGKGVVINKSIVIDFNGYTYSFTEGVGSTGTPSNGFQILQGNTVVLKNGTLNVAESAKHNFYILIQNYANLTVTDMTLDGTNLDKWSATDGDSYTLSNNSGTVFINGNTNIIANDDGNLAVAFDVCKYGSYESPMVYVNTTGKISGKIEVTESISGNLVISGGSFTIDVTEYCLDGDHTVDTDHDGVYTYGNHTYSADWMTDGEKHWHECACGALSEEAVHADVTIKDHKCDTCGYTVSDCLDNDHDHVCDNGCDAYFGEHSDDNTDHACDYGCSVAVGTCEDKNLDHTCDYGCGKNYGTCEDTNTDHKCDYGCDKVYGEHVDAGKDHVCDYGCQETIGTCEDADKDHNCDYGCDKYFGIHADSAEDNDHVCDYGCGAVLEACADNNKDHKCDVCQKSMLLGDLDLDGDVDAKDLTLLARHAAGIELLEDPVALQNADVNGDGQISADDLTMHARYVAGIIAAWEK